MPAVLDIGRVSFGVNADNLVIEHNTAGHRIALPVGKLPVLLEFLREFNNADRRRAFRVPMECGPDLNVSISSGPEKHSATTRDISLVGLAADLPEGAALPVGSKVTVEIELEGHVCRMEGTIRRREGEDCGVEFSACYIGGALTPPDELRQIVAALELEWIRAQAD